MVETLIKADKPPVFLVHSITPAKFFNFVSNLICCK